ncbi:MAG: 50S ribosomal protein L25 [Verrucomicrobiota bacterium]
MKSVPLTVYPRTLKRRGEVKRLRATNRVPAVIYGGKEQPQSLEVDKKQIENLIGHSVSENVLVDLEVSGDTKPKRLALVQEVQHHPLSGMVLHVDFHEVAADEKVTITVPVETTGEAVGVKTGGGVLEHVLFKLKVRALPKDLPEAIYVDVTNLEIGKTIHLGEIPVPQGVEILGDKNIPVIAVAQPKTEAEEAAEAAATATTATEPEMIKEKKEEAGAAAPAAAAEKKPAEKKK